MKKKLFIVLASIIIVFGLFILEESIRLEKTIYSRPLIVFKTDTNLDANDLEHREELYYSLGFKLTRKYLKDEKSSDDNEMYRVISSEFLLFNKFRLWSWTAKN